MWGIAGDEEVQRRPEPWPDSTQVAQACAQLLRDHRLGRLLDAGGGAGILTRYLMNSRVVEAATVLDRHESVLARVPAPITAKHGQLEELGETDGEFTTILLRQVLHYVESPELVLRRLRGRLHPDGVCYVGQIVAPDEDSARWLGRTANWLSATRRRVWTANQLLVAFAHAGLDVHRASIVAHWQALDERTREHVGSLTARTRRSIRIEDRQGTVCCRLYWLHVLLIPAAVPRQARPDEV